MKWEGAVARRVNNFHSVSPPPLAKSLNLPVPQAWPQPRMVEGKRVGAGVRRPCFQDLGPPGPASCLSLKG